MFFLVCVSFLLAFVGFLLLSKDAIFLSLFFFSFCLTTSDSYRTLHLTLGLVGMHSAAFM